MKYIITPYVLICAATAVMSIMLTLFIWQRHYVRGGKLLALLTISLAVWKTALAFEYAACDFPEKILWAKLRYIGILSAPELFLLLALSYNRYDSLLTRRNVMAIFIVPVISFFLVCTNEWHHLIWEGYTMTTNGSNMLIYDYGPAFWVLGVGYSYLLLVCSTVLLLWSVYRFPRAYRFQSIFMIIGVVLPWAGNSIFVFGMSPVPGFQITPILMLLSGCLFAWDLNHLGLLDLLPVARDLLIEKMTDGMLVLDGENRIMDINPVARRLMEPGNEIKVGNTINRFISSWTKISDGTTQGIEPRYRVSLHNGDVVYIELVRVPVSLPNNHFSGQLVIIRDITRRYLAEQDNQRVNEQLRSQLEEIESLQSNLREQALRDPLTGLFNRRFLDESLEREFSYARNLSRWLCLCMLDIDHFKQFNDQYGHIAGDSLLYHLGQVLEQNTRKEDIVCRYGGEEFLLVFPGITLDLAQQRMTELQQKFYEKPVLIDGHTCSACFSCGIAAFPSHGKTATEVLLAADRALYRAKGEGRNRIRALQPENSIQEMNDGNQHF